MKAQRQWSTLSRNTFVHKKVIKRKLLNNMKESICDTVHNRGNQGEKD